MSSKLWCVFCWSVLQKIASPNLPASMIRTFHCSPLCPPFPSLLFSAEFPSQCKDRFLTQHAHHVPPF